MRAFFLSLGLLVVSGCDLFPAEPPTSLLPDAALGGSGGSGGSGGAQLDGGEEASGGRAGQAGAAGSVGVAGAAGAGPVTVTIVVADGPDDVNEDHADYESSNPRVWLGTGNHKNASYAGFRFADVPIPAGATILSARLLLYVPLEEAADIALRFSGEASDDCAPFSAASVPSSRTPTQSLIDYTFIEGWTAATSVGMDGLGGIVAEVVSRPGWQAGNAVCLAAKGFGGADVRRYVASYEGDPARGPRLEVVFLVPEG